MAIYEINTLDSFINVDYDYACVIKSVIPGVTWNLL